MNSIEELGNKLVSLRSDEYHYLIDDIQKIIAEIKKSGRDINDKTSSPLLLTNLNIGLNFIWAREEFNSILRIAAGPVGTVHIILYGNSDCYLFEDEIKELV
ncbi:hypothetical protein ISR92_03835 [Patescibacteria group bacterium]|nr:hypothetical protein [Patescibacteria group bacterium]